MSDIYLSLTETPSVVTLSQPVISGALSSTVTVANTVTVALDANSLSALENVTVTVGAAVSVSNFPASQVVSVSNFPASSSVTIGGFSTSSLPPSTVTVANTVTIAGTVTANVLAVDQNALQSALDQYAANYTDGWPVKYSDGQNFPIFGTVTVGNSVTIGSIPAISGTVTANLKSDLYDGANDWNLNRVAVHATVDGTEWKTVGTDVNSIPLPISGTVTANLDQLSLTNALDFFAVNYTEAFPVSLQSEISGTVTAAAPNGSLTTRFGTPTTANVSFATSAVTNANRKYLLIQNVTTGSNVITVGIGFTPTTTQGIQLTAGAGITFESSYIPTGAVYVLSSVTASNFTILEA